jgi:hypothetical protein
MKSNNIDKFDIAYEMARPNSFTPGEYDLSDREIDRQYVNPFEKIETPAKSDANKKAANDSKKNQTKKAQNSKSAQNKKSPATSVNVVGDRKRSLSESENKADTTAEISPVVAQQNKNNENKKIRKKKTAIKEAQISGELY